MRQAAILLGCERTPTTVRALSDSLNISRSVVSRVADRLEVLNYLQRVEDPADRRSVLLKLTPQGRRFTAATN